MLAWTDRHFVAKEVEYLEERHKRRIKIIYMILTYGNLSWKSWLSIRIIGNLPYTPNVQLDFVWGNGLALEGPLFYF